MSFKELAEVTGEEVREVCFNPPAGSWKFYAVLVGAWYKREYGAYAGEQNVRTFLETVGMSQLAAHEDYADEMSGSINEFFADACPEELTDDEQFNLWFYLLEFSVLK